MSQNITLNGAGFTIPDLGETNWGQNLTDYFVAIPAGVLQKTGGSFTLTTEVDFGGTAGLKTLYYKSRTANPASAGHVRLAVSDVIAFRNNANSADLNLAVDGSNNLTWDGNVLAMTGANVSAGTAGRLALYAASTTIADTVTLTNAIILDIATHGQPSTYTIPDTGAATANFVMTQGVQSIAGNKTFTGEIYSGTISPTALARFAALEAITAHAHYAFIDQSTIDPASGGAGVGHASFSDDSSIIGSQTFDHHHSFQAGNDFAGSGTLTDFSSFRSIPGASGSGTITSFFHFYCQNPSAGATITTQIGLYIGAMTRGATNYGVFVSGTTTPSVFPIIYGGEDAGVNLTLHSTTNGTKGKILIGSISAYDEVNDYLGIGVTAPGATGHINKTGSGIQDVIWMGNQQAVGADVGSSFAFVGTTNNNGMAFIKSAWSGAATNDGAYLILGTRTSDAAGVVEKLRITAAGDIYTVGYTDYSGTSTVVGWTSFTTKSIYYKKIGNLVLVSFAFAGTSDSTSITFTLPYTSAAGLGVNNYARGTDNGADLATPAMIQMNSGSATVAIYKDSSSAAWTNSGGKQASGQFVYEAA